jgi:hypothetical protein
MLIISKVLDWPYFYGEATHTNIDNFIIVFFLSISFINSKVVNFL